MELQAARRMALGIMGAHGLDGWAFGFDRARRRAGSCDHEGRRITLSAPLTLLYTEPQVSGVVLHEVAHALVGARHRHDALWRRTAARLGADPHASLPAGMPAVPAPWVGTCPRCGATRALYGPPRRVVSCGACSRRFRPDLVLRWTYRGVPRMPDGAYRRELARLLRAVPGLVG